jgi:hypothetical protein
VWQYDGGFDSAGRWSAVVIAIRRRRKKSETYEKRRSELHSYLA